MAIQFILGGSGFGKTTYLYNQMIRQSTEEGHSPVIFMLPEQENLAAEKEMVSVHPNGGTMDISIMSFTRLAFKVFDELNVHTYDILDDYGKSMLLMKVLKEQEDALSFYGSMVGKKGFVEEIKSILSEFYQYQVTEQVIDNVLDALTPDKRIYHKLLDIKCIMHAFEMEMSSSYMVAEQLLSMLAEVAGESQMLRGASIYFDGFTGFTPVQYGVIEKLMQVCDNLYFSFTMDATLFGVNAYSKRELFAMSKESVDTLCKLANDCQIKVLPHVSLEDNHRVKASPELKHLERELFRYPIRTYDKTLSDVKLFAAQNVDEEMEFVVSYIKNMVMREGYCYRDFAVITGDLTGQRDMWKQTFEQAEVPCFIDCNEPLLYNPIVEVTSLIGDLFLKDFTYESVFAFMKTEFLALDMDRVFALENYVIQYGVRGYSWWSKPFKGNKKGLGELNETRKQFMDILNPLGEVFYDKESKASDYIRAIYGFMLTNGMSEKLMQKSAELEKIGELRKARAYTQAYEQFVAVLDKTMDILGDSQIELMEFFDVMLTGLREVDLGVIPSTLDQVLVGDMERTRLHHVKVLMVASCNEGILPKIEKSKGLLVDKDRQLLREHDMNLAVDSKELLYQKQFYFYLQTTKAVEQLVVSYHSENEVGEAMKPSYYIKNLKQIFPELVARPVDMDAELFYPTTEDAIIRRFVEMLTSDKFEDSSVLQLMKERKPEWFERILDGYFYNNNDNVLDKAVAKMLYGEDMVHSVSRLETYAGCAYHFFVQYGLMLRKREEYVVKSNHIGTILHAVMQNFFEWVRQEHIQIDNPSDSAIMNKVEELTKEAAVLENETIFDSSFRQKHQLEVIVRIAKRSVENLCRHLNQGDMEPTLFEKRFSPEDQLQYIDMLLDEGAKMELSGVVDRVDIKETEDAVFVKVIDYKSSEKNIDFVKMYEGKQLQLTVYMSVILELLQRKHPNKKIIPTGMFYYHMNDVMIDAIDDAEIEHKRQMNSRLLGVVNEDETARELMDGKTGNVTRVMYTKDGGLDARNSNLLSMEELMKVSDFVREKMIDIGNDILRGRIDMDPQKGENASPCNFCDFRSICRFEAGLGGNRYHVEPKLSKKEAKQIVLHEEG